MSLNVGLKKIDYGFFDIDGTITDDRGMISRTLLTEINKQPFLPIICTGRIIENSLKIWQKYNLSDIFYEKIICQDGNCILDMKTMKYKIIKNISMTSVYQILKTNEDIKDWIVLCPNTMIVSNKSAQLKFKMTYLATPKIIKKASVNTLFDLQVKEPVLAIYFFLDNENQYKHLRIPDIVEKKMKVLNAIRIQPNVTKATGSMYLLKSDFKKLDLEKVISFGDAINDIELLQESEISVCMDKAPKELIALSDIHLKGVSLEEFFKRNDI
ncbi:hypothetical protein DOK67_0000686 [Enterococcus sp. DIV0212c]|uniref:HAD-IIB family hydrolase n=1 Tax=Enterococcus sp. DIV0212c TaxID=2230867 RepID=UPI001A9B192D|nr:HAD-IIB family hydrolase [Enterococcus sp. DIV0212c]MBO1354663.1 HAD-IIB family hydrolase [Enterococcus sp. DIV0212c]